MREKRLLSNTVFLYILTFSNYFFSFITVPYQTRVLGPVFYGRLGFAAAFMMYIQLFIDFGFIMSATERISRNREDKDKVSEIFTVITYCKLVLTAISGAALILLCLISERFSEDILIFFLYFISTVMLSFFPDYVYRGLENMKAITIRNVLIKLFFTILIFIFLKEPEDYYIVPLLNSIGNFVAVVAVYKSLLRKSGVRFVNINYIEIIKELRYSWSFFCSRIATTVYSTTNTFIIGMIYGNNAPQVGCFTSADKLISIGRQGITPITDSLYPYMVVNKDFKLIKKLFILFMPFITAVCIGIGFFSEGICEILFGEAFRSAGVYLRLLMPALWCSFPAMVLGFPVMAPLGLSKYANRSNIISAFIQILQLALLFVAGQLNAQSICIATSITEIINMFYRLSVVMMKGKKWKTIIPK